MTDLEERGFTIAHIRSLDQKQDGVARPRAVLQRNTVLPSNTRSGWGTLPSVETNKIESSASAPAHYVPPNNERIDTSPHGLDVSDRRERSTSMCNQSSGHASEVPGPPLPLEAARLKSDGGSRSAFSRSTSRLSIFSFETAGSSILATLSSLIMPRSRNFRMHAVSKREWRHSTATGPRPLRHSFSWHSRGQRSQKSIKSTAARFSKVSPEVKASRLHGKVSSNNYPVSFYKPKTTAGVALSKMSSPASIVRSYTPKSRSGSSHVNVFGSPEERLKRPSPHGNIPSMEQSVTRQLSQAST